MTQYKYLISDKTILNERNFPLGKDVIYGRKINKVTEYWNKYKILKNGEEVHYTKLEKFIYLKENNLIYEEIEKNNSVKITFQSNLYPRQKYFIYENFIIIKGKKIILFDIEDYIFETKLDNEKKYLIVEYEKK